jgi:hypothetical protein
MQTLIHCSVPAGQHEIRMYGAPASVKTNHGGYELHYVGSILVNSR